MTINLHSLTLALFIIFTGILQAQEEAEQPVSNGTIQDQYDLLWANSNKYQNNKVVKMTSLNKFNQNIQDTLKMMYTEINGLKKTISNSNQSSSALSLQIDSLNSSLSEAELQRDSFYFLGANVGKKSFKSLFWIVSGVLALLLILSIVRSKAKNSQASEARLNLTSLEGEFEEFKKRSREKEQVLARQLQDELNKSL